MVANVDFVARQGDTFLKQFTWKDSLGDPKVDMTNYVIEFNVAPAPGSLPQFRYTIGEGITLDGPNASWELRVPYEDTRKWPRARMRYEMTLRDPNDFRFTKIEGRIDVRPELIV